MTSQKDTRRFFNATSADTTLTLEIYDVIGDMDLFGNGITASAVSDAIAQAGAHDNVTLRINSPGGDCFEGVAIYNLLKTHGKPVNVIVDGLAASAASLIAMCGDTITMSVGSMLMIHPAQGLAMGDAKTVREFADTLDKVSDSIADIYVAQTKLSKQTILDMMNVETWMSAQEAVDNKFATAVSKDAAKITNAFDLSCFKNTPIELKVQTKEVDGEDLTAEDFVYAGNPHDVSTWSLPYHFSTEQKTQSHLRDALARFNQDQVIPESHKPEAWAKLLRLCGQYGIEVSSKEEPTNQHYYSIRLKKLEIERQR